MLDPSGRLIYVGKAKSLRARLLGYFRPKSRDPKAGHIIAQTAAIVWECLPSEFAALLRELELIRRFRPRCNVQGQPHRRRPTYVCVGRRPAPYVFLSSRPPSGVLACFGPVPAGERAREAVRRLNDGFRLRDCPQKVEMIFADQLELFGQPRAAACLRHEIGTCLGPCAALCSRAAYAGQVQAVRAFLEGHDTSLLGTLERDMAAASAALAFERAAALRDRLAVLTWLHDCLARLRQAREEHTFVYPVRGYDGEELWYSIQQGRIVAVAAAPCGPARSQTLAAAVAALQTGRGPAVAALAAHEIDGVFLVAAWFRKHPQERTRTLTPEQAAARLTGRC
jgi:excinuclease ABC subunit C